MVRHEFQRTFYVLRDLRAADLVMALPWLHDKQASLQFGSTKVFTLMDGIAVETTLEERRPECLLMSSTKAQKLMRKTRRRIGRNAKFYVIELTPAADQPTDFHNGEELTAEQRDNFRSLLYDDFPELLQPVNFPHVSRQWDHPIETTGPMRRQRLNRLSLAERVELNRHLKDAVEAGLIRPSSIEFGSPILFVRKVYGSLRLCIDYRGLNEVTRKDAYPLPRVDDTVDELKDANFYTHLDLASGFWQVRVRDQDIHKTTFQTPYGLMEWVAMPFGLCNAPTTFQRMMNDIFRDFLHNFVTVYLDDVHNDSPRYWYRYRYIDSENYPKSFLYQPLSACAQTNCASLMSLCAPFATVESAPYPF
jgi:hypothetical protein